MIQTNTAFRDAIIGSPRQIELLAVVDISDPDAVMLPTTSSGEAPWSRSDQLTNHDISNPARYITLERNRCLLDGKSKVFPDDYIVPEEIGFAGNDLSGPNGEFSDNQWLQVNFQNVSVLQALSLFFSSDPLDGIPVDFTVEVWSGNQRYYTKDVTGNTQSKTQLDGFTVYDPTAVKLTVRKWSLPSRRVRVVEVVFGLFEQWDAGELSYFTATLQGQSSCLSLPYGSVRMNMDNLTRRFEPRKKDSIFQSIEERQSIDFYIGCQTSQGIERVKIGVFYQAGDGWKTSSNEITMSWYLVDIIGLITERTFIVPDTLPTTLGGWLKAIVSQLGDNFVNLWHADPAYTDKPVTANSREDVTGKKCGDILRWACQASGTWPRADQETGRLTAEPLWNEGIKVTLDNLESYPTMKANESLAALIFQLADGNNTEYIVSGNSTTSEKTVTIINPFLHTTDQALAAARLILAQYGGNVLELTGRGDPSSEIGDVDTVWLDESSATTARRMSQTFQISNGVLRGCRSTLIQADGSYLWEEFVVIRKSGKFKAPPGVHELRIVLGQAGQGGGYGENGWVEPFYNGSNSVGSGYGAPGQDGQGGAIWYGVIPCNDEQEFDVHLGEGGAPASKAGVPGEMGGHTTFGAYSSENGRVYVNGYTDIANGQSFARTGVAAPLPGSGDGGKGGAGGDPGVGYLYQEDGDIGYRYEEVSPGGPGHPGVAGATGFAMVTWDKEGT